MKLSVVDRIQPQSNKFAMGVENEATGDLKLNDSPCLLNCQSLTSILALNNNSRLLCLLSNGGS